MESTNQETTSGIDVGALKVITLCGSTRFKTAFREWEARLEIEEPAVVLSVAMWSPTAKVMPTPAQNELLDAIHLRKIDLSDEIFVLDVNGYIGQATRREIEYAEGKGKRVRKLSEEHPGWTDNDAKYFRTPSTQEDIGDIEWRLFQLQQVVDFDLDDKPTNATIITRAHNMAREHKAMFQALCGVWFRLGGSVRSDGWEITRKIGDKLDEKLESKQLETRSVQIELQEPGKGEAAR